VLKEEKKDVVASKGENKKAVASIDKEQIERILNPTDILKEIAKNERTNVVEGEDEVNIEAMKFKYYSYFYKFKRLLYQVWEYPTKSIYNGEEGIVRIRFSILRDGTITNVRIVESSGYPDLDSAAVKALKTMKGVPLPDSYKLNYFTSSSILQSGPSSAKVHKFLAAPKPPGITSPSNSATSTSLTFFILPLAMRADSSNMFLLSFSNTCSVRWFTTCNCSLSGAKNSTSAPFFLKNTQKAQLR